MRERTSYRSLTRLSPFEKVVSFEFGVDIQCDVVCGGTADADRNMLKFLAANDRMQSRLTCFAVGNVQSDVQDACNPVRSREGSQTEQHPRSLKRPGHQGALFLPAKILQKVLEHWRPR